MGRENQSPAMAKFVNDIEVFNAALIRVGEEPILENDTSAEATLYRGVYDNLVMDLLTRHKWSFARKVHRLEKQGLSGNTPKYVYILPNDFLIAHMLTCESEIIQNYELRSGKLLCDLDSEILDLHYSYDAPPRDWFADFTEATVMKLMAVIKRALHDDTVEAERLSRQAEDAFLDALARDRQSQGKPPHSPIAPLVDRWRGVGRRA